MKTSSFLPSLRGSLFAAAALLLCSSHAGAQNELIPPGSALAPEPAPVSAVQPVTPAPAAKPKPAAPEISVADLQALYSRNAEILGVQKKMMERLDALEAEVRQLRIRAARN